MKRPVVIFRHYFSEGPGFLGEYLTKQQIPWTLIPLDEGAAVPNDPNLFSGLVFMGGPMSVNDDLPWIPPALTLIREAVRHHVPVLGHCLGSQLMSRALGGTVSRNPQKEIGWGPVFLTAHEVAHRWFGPRPSFQAFHWHGDTWSLPKNAILLAKSPLCPHQAFAIGPHLGMQFHIEMTENLIHTWCENGKNEIAASPGEGVQPAEIILRQTPLHLPELRQSAHHVYGQWTSGLRS